VLERRLARDLKNRSQADSQFTVLVALVVPVLWSVSSARAATDSSQSLPPSRYSRIWATASNISRAFLPAQLISSLAAAPGAIFQDLNNLSPATAFPQAPALAVLGLQSAAQGLFPGCDIFFLLIRHCGPNAQGVAQSVAHVVAIGHDMP
jgi:hypothetical protein